MRAKGEMYFIRAAFDLYANGAKYDVIQIWDIAGEKFVYFKKKIATPVKRFLGQLSMKIV